MSHYLDASVILPTLVEEASSARIDAFMESCNDGLAVSDFAAAEVASALSRLIRMRELSKADASARLADFDEWRAVSTENVDMVATDGRLANVFVRRFDLRLRAPDALHAAICRRAGHCLVTLDLRLADAVRELGVEVVVPSL